MRDKIIDYRQQGMTYREIREQLGCSKGTISYHLGIGQKEKTRKRSQHYRASVREYIQKAKTKPCADCGETYPYWIMQFDHIRDKVFGLSRCVSERTFDEIRKEIEKCEVVCANCHHNRTFLRRLQTGGNVSWAACEEFDPCIRDVDPDAGNG